MEKQKRTLLQNNSLHLYCQMLAEALNEAGIGQAMFLQDFEIDNSMESIKNVFREIGRLKYNKESTAKLTTKEVTEIYDEINRQVSKRGIYIPFPSEESRSLEENY